MGARHLIDRALAEETLREPLAVTCYLPVVNLDDEPTFSVAVPIFEATYETEDDEHQTGHLAKRPERVSVKPVPVLHPMPVVRGQKEVRRRPEPVARSPEPWRPERARPAPARPIQSQPPVQPRRKITPRADTIRSKAADRIDVISLALFWGVALAGSLVAIGIALASW
jgi:hypothetical protein